MDTWKPRRCSEIKPTNLDWIWPGYLVRSKLAVLDGDPGMGKSLIALDLIARLTRGGPMPDGTPLARACNCLILSTEDDPADTIRPRAEAAGADLSRLIIPDFGGQPVEFPDHLQDLYDLIVQCQAPFVVIDPLMAFLAPRVAANVDQCVRHVLTELTKVAAFAGSGILSIRHLTKKPNHRAILRGQGSIAILGAARTALLAAPHPGAAAAGSPREPGAPQRVLAVSKGNLSARSRSQGYRIVRSKAGPPVIEWTGPVDLTADELCKAPPRADPPLRMRDRAADWLRRELAGGPRRVSDLYAAAAAAGIPERTVDRAKATLAAPSHRVHDAEAGRAEWYWYDPAAPWPEGAAFQKPKQEELPPLVLD
jgi:hypothetical protein